MAISLNRVMLFVQDVQRLSDFYADLSGMTVVEAIEGEWAVLRTGACELALHRVGEAWRVDDPSEWRVENNVKLVFSVDQDLEALRRELIGKGVEMDEVKSFPGPTGPLCDGRDPEGNVFQLTQLARAEG